MRIFADFDGTIALPDVTDLVLESLAAPEWEVIERAWLSGDIDAATCMRSQIALIDCDAEALHEVLDSVLLDPHFPAFVAWCEATKIKLSIVSDGVDYFIQRILDNHGLGQIPVFANTLKTAGGGYELRQPWSSPGCAALQGVCKCAVVDEALAPLIYIGDGRSDECVALRADILFAKGKLATFCDQRRVPFIPFQSFTDIQDALMGALTAGALKIYTEHPSTSSQAS